MEGEFITVVMILYSVIINLFKLSILKFEQKFQMMPARRVSSYTYVTTA
jgi:hypothetical protein